MKPQYSTNALAGVTTLYSSVDALADDVLGRIPLPKWPRTIKVYRHDVVEDDEIDVVTMVRANFQDWIDDDPEIENKLKELDLHKTRR